MYTEQTEQKVNLVMTTANVHVYINEIYNQLFCDS
jgi:hypothetical protein